MTSYQKVGKALVKSEASGGPRKCAMGECLGRGDESLLVTVFYISHILLALWKHTRSLYTHICFPC